MLSDLVGKQVPKKYGMPGIVLQPGHEPAGWKCLLSGKPDILRRPGHVAFVLKVAVYGLGADRQELLRVVRCLPPAAGLSVCMSAQWAGV